MKYETIHYSTSAPSAPMIALYGGRIHQVIQIITSVVRNEDNETYKKDLLVVSPEGLMYILEEFLDVQEYNYVYYRSIDINSVVRILAAANDTTHGDGKIRIDKKLINDIFNAGIKVTHQDTGEEMTARQVFDSLSNMSKAKDSCLVGDPYRY